MTLSGVSTRSIDGKQIAERWEKRHTPVGRTARVGCLTASWPGIGVTAWRACARSAACRANRARHRSDAGPDRL